MDPSTIPVFDPATPWVAVIQLVLVYVLPRLTGLVTDRLTKPTLKILVLGVLSVIGTALTWLLGIAVANTWSGLDWSALLTVVVNASLVFLFSNVVYKSVIQPTGQAAKDAANDTVKIIGPDPKLVMQEAFVKADLARADIAQREVAAKVDELAAKSKK